MSETDQPRQNKALHPTPTVAALRPARVSCTFCRCARRNGTPSDKINSMGIIQNLKQFFGRITELEKRPDPVFGVVQFEPGDFWTGNIFFSPIEMEVEVIIDSGEEGPTDQQREFYKELEERYPLLVDNIAATLFEVFAVRAKWKEGFQRKDVWHEFKLEAINIPNCEVTPLNWELSYLSASNGHNFDVQMKDWSIEAVEMNG